MAFIATIPVDQASGEVQALYEANQGSLGYVPNYAKLFSHRPQVMTAWGSLLGSVRSQLEPRRYELVTLAAARALQSSYCMLAHGSVLQQFYSAEQLSAVAADFRNAGLEPTDVAIMAFAEQLVRDASSVTAQDVAQLRGHGLSDAEIFDVAAVAAARCFFSKLLDALGAEPDAAYADLEGELQKRLTVGRPIDQTAVERLPSPT